MGDVDDTSRGAQAYMQAYQHITAGGAYHTARKMRKAAWRYLLLTATPPLTDDEEAHARAAMRQMRRTKP